MKWLAGCALLLLPVLAPGIAGQRFTSHADAVRVDVLVADGARLVAGLAADDFELRDNGVVQRVVVTERESLPVNVICVFDTSGSVAGNRLQRLARAGTALLSGLQPRDRLALVTFANRVRLLSPLTGDAPQIREAFSSLNASGRTMLRDAVFAGLALREEAQGRALLLVFSDGYDTASWVSQARLLEATKRTDVVVYSVAVPNPVAERHGRVLEALADETGGRVLRARGNRDLGETFVRILDEFRERYVLSYSPGDPSPGWHTIDVRLKSKRGAVTARRGYFVE
jgi:VWFA-related protein